MGKEKLKTNKNIPLWQENKETDVFLWRTLAFDSRWNISKMNLSILNLALLKVIKDKNSYFGLFCT